MFCLGLFLFLGVVCLLVSLLSCYFVRGLVKFLLELVVIQLLFLFNLTADYWFLLLGQRLKIGFLSLSVCFVDINVFFCFSLLTWCLNKVVYDVKYAWFKKRKVMCLCCVAGKCHWSNRDEELHVAQMGAEQ